MKLEIRNICKSFGTKKVLDNVSFTAESGRAYGLLGRNGAGKTTSIRILMDVFPADSGEIFLDGKPIEYSRVKIGYLPEERGLYSKKKIAEQLIYFAELKGMSRKEAVAAVDYWLERLGMMEYRNRKLEVLSKGNQQKIQLITAVSHNPDILILDEPFSGLDPVNAKLLEDVVKSEIEKGKIVLFSSHQMNYIEEFCDDIAILNNGKIAISGDLNAIKKSYERNKLVIKGKDIDLIEKALSENISHMDEETLLFTLPSADKKGEAMKYIADNYDVDEIKVFEPSLNHIFVEYAGDREEEKNETV